MSSQSFEKETKRDQFFLLMEKELGKFVDKKTGEIPKNLLNKIKCPLCGKNKEKKLFKKQGFQFVRCNECGLVYVNPRLVEEKIIMSYEKDSKANQLWKSVLQSKKQIDFNKSNYGLILKNIKRIKPKGKLLDIGCSYGHFLKLASEKGYIVEGIELENTAADYAEKKYNFKVHKKELERCGFRKQSFDVISALGVLEHVVDPVGLLKNVNKILAPNGVLVLTIPNVESLVCMLLKDNARTFTGRNHLTYFSLRTLNAILSKTGFKIIWHESYVSGLNSILNHMQSYYAFGNLKTDFLPEETKRLILKKKYKIESFINKIGLGYKLRVVAIKTR